MKLTIVIAALLLSASVHAADNLRHRTISPALPTSSDDLARSWMHVDGPGKTSRSGSPLPEDSGEDLSPTSAGSDTSTDAVLARAAVVFILGSGGTSSGTTPGRQSPTQEISGTLVAHQPGDQSLKQEDCGQCSCCTDEGFLAVIQEFWGCWWAKKND